MPVLHRCVSNHDVFLRQRVCCGIIYKGRFGEVLIDPHLFKPCCRRKQQEQQQEAEEEDGYDEEEEEEEVEVLEEQVEEVGGEKLQVLEELVEEELRGEELPEEEEQLQKNLFTQEQVTMGTLQTIKQQEQWRGPGDGQLK